MAWTTRIAVVAVSIAGVTGAPRASATPDQCALQELDATRRKLVAELGCHARGLWLGEPVDGRCVEHADAAFEAAFSRAVRGASCAFVGPTSDVDAVIDSTREGLLANLPSDPDQGRCAATLLRAASRRAFRETGCYRRTSHGGLAVDPACRAEANARLLEAFASAEKRFTCGPGADVGVVQSLVADFATDAVALITTMPPHDPAPSRLAAAVVGAQVELTWVAPHAGWTNPRVRVLRRLNAAPEGPEDPAATVVYFGTAASASDALTALLPSTPETGRIYHYTAFGCTADGVCETTGTSTTLTPTVVQALRGGGYVLHWRHSAATVCQDNLSLGTAATTMSPDWWKSCDAACPPGGMATARQLDATGVMEATRIGQTFDTLGIPIGRVQTSEFCRNVTTAQLMDFGPAIEQRQDITFFVYDEAQRCANSFALLAVAPPPGTNAAIIGHAGFTCDVLGTLAWSEVAIYKPDGVGGSEFVTRVLWNAWPTTP